MILFSGTLQNQAPGPAVVSALLNWGTLGSPSHMNKASCTSSWTLNDWQCVIVPLLINDNGVLNQIWQHRNLLNHNFIQHAVPEKITPIIQNNVQLQNI